jgi:CheY-specific phosphatase CheX
MKLSQTHRQILFNTVEKVLEEAAFALVDLPDAEQDEERAPEAEMASAVEFSGFFAGATALIAPVSLARIFAANMMGLEEDDPEADGKMSDALGELMNMICGNLLPQIAGRRPEFKILAPRPASPEACRSAAAGCEEIHVQKIRVMVEGRPAEFFLFVESDLMRGLLND